MGYAVYTLPTVDSVSLVKDIVVGDFDTTVLYSHRSDCRLLITFPVRLPLVLCLQ